jgi:nucleoside-diphosphate-sugar epimerase
MNRILITGSNGFVGQNLCKKLISKKYLIRKIIRSSLKKKEEHSEVCNVGEINKDTNWSIALKNIDCVIHCAARVHSINEDKADSLDLYRKINVDGTRNLAEQSVKAGVKRIIFLSSIKVNGEETKFSSPFKYDDVPKPESSYAISKWEAEQALEAISKKYGIEIVIIRPPLIYGPNVKGNFLRLINLANHQIPFPISKVNNLRSFVSLNNLVDLICCCINHPSAPGKVFLVSDGMDISTLELIKKIGYALGKPQRLIPIPLFILRFLGKIIGKSSEVERLLGDCQVDCKNTCEVLNWKPYMKIDDGILESVKHYLSQK